MRDLLKARRLRERLAAIIPVSLIAHSGAAAFPYDAPALPAAPAPPQLLPCAPGWSEVTDASIALCEPWPATAPACTGDEARFPGDAACHRVGTACTSDDWATDLPTTGTILYVRPNATAGTGTRAAPFATITAALAAAPAGAIVALSKGTFTEVIHPKSGVTLWGACTAQTKLASPRPELAAIDGLDTTATAWRVKNLTITGPKAAILFSGANTSMELVDLLIDAAGGTGLGTAYGAHVTGHDVVIRGTALRSDAKGGYGIDAEFGGVVTLSRVSFERNHTAGVYALGSATIVELTDAVISDTEASGDGAVAFGVQVDAATFRLTRGLVERNTALGLYGTNVATLTVTDSLIRDTKPSANTQRAGVGLLAENSSKVSVTRCALTGNRTVSLTTRSQSTITASHLVVLRTQPTASTGADGVGLELLENSTIALDHLFVADSHAVGLSVNGSVGTLTDIDVSATRAPAQTIGVGLQFVLGADVSGARLRSNRNEGLGALVAGSQLVGEDLTVSENLVSPQTKSEGGGLGVQLGSTVVLTRVAAIDDATIAVTVRDPGTVARIDDLTITDVTSDALGEWGRAIHLEGPAQLTVHRAKLQRVADVGVMLSGGAQFAATDLELSDVVKRACTRAGTCDDVGGSAVTVLGAGSLFSAQRFSLGPTAQCGVQLAEGAGADLFTGVIHHNVIGVCSTEPTFDLARVSNDVEYVENTRKLDASAVPLPVATRPGY